MTTLIRTSEELKAMSREMSNLYDEGFGIKEAEKVARVLWSAKKAAAALEAGLTGSFVGSAHREIKAAVEMYETFKANN